MDIKPYSELEDLPHYEDLCETSYNTILKAYNELPEVLFDKDYSCEMGGYSNLLLAMLSDEHFCGTSMCIMGAYPLVIDIPKNITSIKEFQLAVIPKVFRGKKTFLTTYVTMWDFLYSGGWSVFQNTFDLAFERHLIVLSGNFTKHWSFEKDNEKYFDKFN